MNSLVFTGPSRKCFLPIRRASVVLATLFASSFFTNQVAAQLLVQTVAGYHFQDHNGTVDVSLQNPSGVVIDSASYSSPIFAGHVGTSSITAYVDYGILKISATSDADYGVNPGAEVGAGFFDILRIGAAGLTGTTGVARIQLDHHWLQSVSANSFGDANTLVQVGLVFAGSSVQLYHHVQIAADSLGARYTLDHGLQQVVSIRGQPEVRTSMPTEVIVDLPFVFGEDFQMAMSFSALTSASGGFGSMSHASVDGSNSLYWGGILNVVDDQGNSVDFGLTSGSGTDYLNSFKPQETGDPSAVPESSSATLALLCMGLAGLGWMRHKVAC